MANVHNCGSYAGYFEKRFKTLKAYMTLLKGHKECFEPS
jgi:hypothetical protein